MSALRPVFHFSDLSKLRGVRHTLQEKRKMRNARKRKKRNLKSLEKVEVVKELVKEREKCREVITKNIVIKNMAKTFWERWRHELEEHKALQRRAQEQKFNSYLTRSSDITESSKLQVVDRSLLSDPIEFGKRPSDRDLFVGRGSFGVVKCQIYRGICVAVKEFLPHTVEESVVKEAQILSKLCHPYLPLFSGVCTAKNPYILILQYYGIGFKSITIHRELNEHKFLRGKHQTWVILCAQIIEALVYLHREVNIIHNDIKGDNILLTEIEQLTTKSPLTSEFQVIMVDFGKATDKKNGKKYHLSSSEKHEYLLYHSYIAPELINGLEKQNVCSDIYSLGKLLHKILKSELLDTKKEVTEEFNTIVQKCVNNEPRNRPTIMELQKTFNRILNEL